MAKKKLLCVLVLGVFYLPIQTIAARIENIKSVDLSEEVHEIKLNISQFEQSMNFTLKNIKEKFLELVLIGQKTQNLTNSSDDKTLTTQPLNIPSFSEISIKVFVSSSMSVELLKSYISEARKYKASLIFSGLINGSFVETQKFVMSLIEKDEEEVPFLINDDEFREFNITSVPTIILNKEEGLNFNGDNSDSKKVFDKVTGNVGIRGALTLFAAEGDLAEYAIKLLEDDK